MINFRGVTKFYTRGSRALSGVDLSVSPGEFVFVAGASGAGKSTLLKLLYGAEKASSGTVLVNGRNLSSIPESSVMELRRRIGIVFQDYRLLTRRSIVDNVAFPLEVMGIKRRDRRQRAKTLLESIGLLDRAKSYPLELSGGEQQRVALARALIAQPLLILADEPTGNLDRDMSETVMELLFEANCRGAAVVVATHNLPLIEKYGRRAIVLDKGKIIGDYEGKR